MQVSSAAALLTQVVDYAGLFPPAGLGMPEAIAEFAHARGGPDAWMLGRFVTPAARLSELAEALAAAPASGQSEGGYALWRVSAIVRESNEADVSAVSAFNGATPRGAHVDSVEIAPSSPDGVAWTADRFAAIGERYVELPAGADPDHWMPRLVAAGCRAKVRTGGLTATAFPEPEALLRFVSATLTHRVPFKATAGLHHAVCGAYRLTYAPDAESARMFGFLNLLLATAALQAGLPESAALGLLTSTSADSLLFTHDAIQWGTTRLPARILPDLRTRHLVSFGSCSFREPADEFRALIA